MKLNDIITVKQINSLIKEAEDNQIKQIILDYLMAIKASNIDSVPVNSIIKYIKMKYSIETTFGELSKLVAQEPIVKDMNQETITLNLGDDTELTHGSNPDSVEHGAQQAAAKALKND